MKNDFIIVIWKEALKIDKVYHPWSEAEYAEIIEDLNFHKKNYTVHTFNKYIPEVDRVSE